jgi:hypothetical protein
MTELWFCVEAGVRRRRTVPGNAPPVRFVQSQRLVHGKCPVGALDEHDLRLTPLHKSAVEVAVPARGALTKPHDSP